MNVAEYIFGKDEGYLHGKTTQYKPHQAQAIYVNTPKDLTERYQSVTLSADLMFVNGIPFFVTFSHHIKFITDLMTKEQRFKPGI